MMAIISNSGDSVGGGNLDARGPGGTVEEHSKGGTDELFPGKLDILSTEPV